MDWKLDRLRNWYAWKYWFNIANILLVSLFCCIVWMNAQFVLSANIKTFLWIFVSLLAVFITLDSVCSPQDIFVLDKNGTYACIYKEYRHHYCIIVKNGKAKTEIWASEYDCFYEKSPKALFVYRLLHDDKWYLWRKNAEAELLGERLNEILFRLNDKEHGITALAYHEIQFFSNAFTHYEDVFIPPMAQITDADGVLLERPDELLLMKNGGRYVTYGFYLASKMPYYRKVCLSALIFRDNTEKVLILWNKEQKIYTELYRGHNMSRQMNSFFVEFDDDYQVGGKIFRYNAETNQLLTVYQGNFRSMDFESGVIVGDDGVTYGGKCV